MSSSIFFYVYIWALFISSSICSMLYMNIVYAIKNLFYVCINTVYVTKHLFYVYIWTLLISSVFFLFIIFTYELCLSHQGFVLCLYMNIVYEIKNLFGCIPLQVQEYCKTPYCPWHRFIHNRPSFTHIFFLKHGLSGTWHVHNGNVNLSYLLTMMHIIVLTVLTILC